MLWQVWHVEKTHPACILYHIVMYMHRSGIWCNYAASVYLSICRPAYHAYLVEIPAQNTVDRKAREGALNGTSWTWAHVKYRDHDNFWAVQYRSVRATWSQTEKRNGIVTSRTTLKKTWQRRLLGSQKTWFRGLSRRPPPHMPLQTCVTGIAMFGQIQYDSIDNQ